MLTPLVKDYEHLEELLGRVQKYPEIEIASEYGEPGYTLEEGKGILLGNWNADGGYKSEESKRMAIITAHLEKYFELEWRDEWIVLYDDGCKAYRTSADSYSWTSSIEWFNGEAVSHNEITNDPECYFDEFMDDPNKAWKIDAVDLSEYGFSKVNLESFENGFYHGQNDNPKDILEGLQSHNPEYNYIFELDSVGQFDIHFSVWKRPVGYTLDN